MRPQTGTVNGIAHIYDPRTDTERTVKYPTTQSGYDIARVKLGRFCDVIASSVNIDGSKFVTGFCAASSYLAASGGCVVRSGLYGRANGGLVYAEAGRASSYSGGFYGARLAFSGELTNDAEIDKQIEANLEEYDEETK